VARGWCKNPRLAQNTLVVKLDAEGQERLRGRLDGGDFEYRSVDHASFSARGEGVVATLYLSGKLVVQGKGAEVFVARYLDAVPVAKAGKSPSAPPAASRSTRPVIGSDETGKGDYFGPLVVVACRVEPHDQERLLEGGVMDSKLLTDDRVRRLAPALQERFAHAIEVLEPPAYNEEHARQRNLNPMLADLHARAIRRLAEPADHVVVDRFAREELLQTRLADLDVKLEQFPRAERVPAVAAASVIARYVFLEGLRELSEQFAIDLRKGAGKPTDMAAQSFVDLHGFDALGAVAKLHFKNTMKIPNREGGRG